MKDKKHAKVMKDYIKYLGDYFLDSESHYSAFNIDRFTDVVSFEYDERRGKIVIVLAEIKSYITDVGRAIRQVKKQVRSFMSANKEFVHELLEEAMLKLSKTGKTFVLGSKEESNYDVRGILVVPLTKQTIQQINSYDEVLQSVDTYFLVKEKRGDAEKINLVNIRDDAWKKAEPYKV